MKTNYTLMLRFCYLLFMGLECLILCYDLEVRNMGFSYAIASRRMIFVSRLSILLIVTISSFFAEDFIFCNYEYYYYTETEQS